MPDAAPLFSHLHHVCIVVRDIGRAEAAYAAAGIGPFRDYPPLTEYTRLETPNPDAFAAMKYRIVDLANIQIQLCEPPEADCPQRRFLEEKGEGVFHLGFAVGDLDAALGQAAAAGLRPLMQGRRPDETGFIYFDTAKDAGVVLEVRRGPSPPP